MQRTTTGRQRDDHGTQMGRPMDNQWTTTGRKWDRIG
nr:MAG TPA: hypothetical protein [Caudoviricetes sp.]